ncbi:hypothetical protein JXQ31_11420 [candidate division KSB1 bacterium]|nr:hypothetical protein [candidate division KSB1 bacterium]
MVIRNYKYVIFCLIIIFFFITVSLFSQETGEQDKKIEDEQTVQTENQEKETQESPELEDTDVKLFVDKIEVNGQLEKPQALFFLPGSTPDIDDIHIEHSFFTEIFRPVEKRGRIQTNTSTEPANKERKDYIPW